MSTPNTQPGKRGRLAGFAIVTVAVVTGCTSYIQPTTCESGSTSCSGIHDARFCEFVATGVEGTACAALGLVEAKPFCVVTTSACIETSYAVKDQDCKVLHYETVRNSTRAECPSGAPMFVSQ
jgi:hypothetical protein